jgi:serine/threonine-protein kinase HipA
MSSVVEVWIDWNGAARMVGSMHPAAHGESIVFRYAADWLGHPDAFAIDPVSLPLNGGTFPSLRLPGAVADAGPDRWGRILIERAVRQGLLEKRPYRSIDYLLAVDDVARIGALRFRWSGTQAFAGIGSGVIPPLVRLRELLAATDAVHEDRATPKDLRFLLGAGSPLGGARPKCLVSLPDGRVAIAKFSRPDDTRDIPAGEILGMAVARAAGIRTADHDLVRADGRSVAVIARFDRVGVQRLPLISASTLLGLFPDDSGSYTRLADAIRVHGDRVQEDLAELWRRVIYSIMASNFDDHMRNHAFLLQRPAAWSLAPAFDINPTPAIDRARQPKTPVSEDSRLLDEPATAIDEAFRHAARFGLETEQARRICDEVRQAVSQWRSIGKRIGIPAATLSAYADAFHVG